VARRQTGNSSQPAHRHLCWLCRRLSALYRLNAVPLAVPRLSAPISTEPIVLRVDSLPDWICINLHKLTCISCVHFSEAFTRKPFKMLNSFVKICTVRILDCNVTFRSILSDIVFSVCEIIQQTQTVLWTSHLIATCRVYMNFSCSALSAVQSLIKVFRLVDRCKLCTGKLVVFLSMTEHYMTLSQT